MTYTMQEQAPESYELREGDRPIKPRLDTLKEGRAALLRWRKTHPGRSFRLVDLIDPGRDCEPEEEHIERGHWEP